MRACTRSPDVPPLRTNEQAPAFGRSEIGSTGGECGKGNIYCVGLRAAERPAHAPAGAAQPRAASAKRPASGEQRTTVPRSPLSGGHWGATLR
jgi:hypothetical protein